MGTADADDCVAAVPIERFVQDIRGQIQMANKLAAGGLLKQQRAESTQASQKEKRDAILKSQLEIDEMVAKGEIDDEQAIVMRESSIARINQAYGGKEKSSTKPALFEKWMGDDKTKKLFITALQQSGEDLSAASPEHLESLTGSHGATEVKEKSGCS